MAVPLTKITIVLTLFVISSVCAITLPNSIPFHECYTNYSGKNISPRTTDYFIYLIDKIEHDITFEYSISELATVLLSKFRASGISYTDSSFTTSSSIDLREKAVFSLIPSVTNKNRFQQLNSTIDAVINTFEEFCAMHFMLSHAYNEVNASSQHKSGPYIYEEYGTIYSPFGTTFGGSILAGIAASGATKPTVQTSSKKMHVDRVYGTTIAEFLAVASLYGYVEEHQILDKLFGPGGQWNGTKCTKNFILTGSYPSMPLFSNTYAYINGAVDGYLLGKSIKNYESQNHHLATILKNYFGSEDVYSVNATACWRWTNYRKTLGVVDATLAMNQYLKDAKDAKVTQSNSQAVVMAVTDYFHDNVIPDIEATVGIITGACAKPKQPYIRSTDAEVILIMDSIAPPSTNLLAAEILIGLNTNGSTIGVYTNVAQRQTLHALSPIGSGTKIELVCAAENYAPDNITSHSLSATINAVGKFFAFKNKNTMDDTYMPPQIAIIMRQKADQDEAAVSKALDNLADYQPGVTLLVMGNFSLSKLPDANMFPLSSEPLRSIHERIYERPGNLKYDYCMSSNADKEKSMKYVGRVSPNHIKFLAVNPSYFKSSSKVTITFKLNSRNANSMVLKVFQQRGKLVSESSDDFIQLDKKKNEHSFVFDKPCSKYDEGKCAEISFAIVGVSCNDPKNYCCRDKDHCSMPDQIPYEVTHEGLYCGSALKILPSSLIITSILITLFTNKYFM